MISDLAFWGDKAYQGTFDGFRILDIDDPRNPKVLLDYDQCANAERRRSGRRRRAGAAILVPASWDSNTTCSLDVRRRAGANPDYVRPDLRRYGNGFEGLHVFDVAIPATRTWSRPST